MDLSRTRLERLIDEHIFSERDRNILKCKWFDGMTYEAIAEQFMLSPRHVPRIVERCELIIIKYIYMS